METSLKKLCNQLKPPSCHNICDLMSTNTAWYRDSQTVLEWSIFSIGAEVAVPLPDHCPVSHIVLNQTRQTHQPPECWEFPKMHQILSWGHAHSLFIAALQCKGRQSWIQQPTKHRNKTLIRVWYIHLNCSKLTFEMPFSLYFQVAFRSHASHSSS